MKSLLLLLPLSALASVLASAFLGFGLGRAGYAVAFLLSLLQAVALVLAARPEPEKLPISVYGKDVRSFEARSPYSGLPVGIDIPPKPYEPDERTKRRLLLLLRNETGDGKRIPQEGVALSFRLLKKYKIGRGEAVRLREYVVKHVGYRTDDGVVYLAWGKARDFRTRMIEKGKG